MQLVTFLPYISLHFTMYGYGLTFIKEQANVCYFTTVYNLLYILLYKAQQQFNKTNNAMKYNLTPSTQHI